MSPVDTPRSEMTTKLERLRESLTGGRWAGAALSARRNVAWLTAGADTHVVRAAEEGVLTLLVTPSELVAIAAVNEVPRIRDEELAGLDLEVVAVPWEDPGATDRIVAARAGGPIARDADIEPEVRRLRTRLSPAEQDRLAAVGRLAAEAMTDVLLQSRPGELESVVAARLAGRLAADGAAAPVLLAASDERLVRYRHPIPKPKPISASLMLVVVAERGGLHAAVTRMAWLRGRPDPETLERYRASARIDRAFRDATIPGRTLAEVLETGVRAYAAEGHPDEWRLHHQGGSIAYQPRETIATPTSGETVEPGMAFAFNPSITGAKAEETFILRPDGRPEVVTVDPRWPAEADGGPAILLAGD